MIWYKWSQDLLLICMFVMIMGFYWFALQFNCIVFIFSVIQVKGNNKSRAAHCLYLKEHSSPVVTPEWPQGKTLLVYNVPAYCKEVMPCWKNNSFHHKVNFCNCMLITEGSLEHRDLNADYFLKLLHSKKFNMVLLSKPMKAFYQLCEVLFISTIPPEREKRDKGEFSLTNYSLSL